jgi:DDE superfamily endonuclease
MKQFLGECWHCHNKINTSSKEYDRYFREVLFALSSAPFYNRYVHLPPASSPTPKEISDNPKFFPFFSGALGAMDGTHIQCCPSAEEREAAQNRKGFCSQNCLACCSFDLRFLYVLSGWDGSAADASVFNDARQHDLVIPATRYYLADAGFGACDVLLVPYRGTRYHLREWGRASVRYDLYLQK